jgi:hypothetical protein
LDQIDSFPELSIYKERIIHADRGRPMKLNQRDIVILSSMIRGDGPSQKIFPYRKTEKLAVFFQNLGLNYTFDGSLQRIQWVESVIKDLNEQADPEAADLSIELKKVIRGVLDSNDYIDLRYTKLEKAKKLMDQMLKEYQLNLNTILNPEQEITRNPPKPHSQKKEEQFLKITPQVFTIPQKKINNNLVSVMMPFSKEFQEIYDSIKQSCEDANMSCQRADNVWENSMIIQDIVDLIFTSGIVVADFSTRNPNVFYEVGIAHTLGKHVIPIAQNKDDIPFDLHHHRVLFYQTNNEGRNELKKGLTSRINTIKKEFLTDKK